MRENRRDLPTHGPWREQHRVAASCSMAGGRGDGMLGVAFQFGIHVAEGNASSLRRIASQASFQAAVEIAAERDDHRAGRPFVLAAEEIPVPSNGWELRTTGLWADHNCETPFEHWSYGLEAFALGVDDRAELLARGYGDRTPLGWELDFEADAEIEPIDRAVLKLDGYAQSGRLHGILQFADGEVDVAGPANRWHWWGEGPLEGNPMLGVPDGDAVALPSPDGVWWVAPLRRDPSSSAGGEAR